MDTEFDTKLSPDDPYAPLLDHLVRYWEAEEENARRLHNRVNLQLTLVAAFLGVGFYRFLNSPVGTAASSIAAHLLVMFGLVVLLYGGLMLLGLGAGIEDQGPVAEEKRRKRWRAWLRTKLPSGMRYLIRLGRGKRPKLASLLMRIEVRDLASLGLPPDPSPGSSQMVRALMVRHMFEASYRLGELNDRESSRINDGQQVIGFGFALVVLGVLLNVFGWWSLIGLTGLIVVTILAGELVDRATRRRSTG